MNREKKVEKGRKLKKKINSPIKFLVIYVSDRSPGPFHDNTRSKGLHISRRKRQETLLAKIL